jgi:hypothetical protein
MPDFDNLRLLDKAHLLDEIAAIYCGKCPQNDTLIKREGELRDKEAVAERLQRENAALRLRVSQLEAENLRTRGEP